MLHKLSRYLAGVAKRLSCMTDTLDEGARRKLPRLLSRSQAANYRNVSMSTFSNWVRSGKLPPPLPGTRRWDVKAIDFALDAMSELQPSPEQDVHVVLKGISRVTVSHLANGGASEDKL
jgi:hypothetical protein